MQYLAKEIEDWASEMKIARKWAAEELQKGSSWRRTNVNIIKIRQDMIVQWSKLRSTKIPVQSSCPWGLYLKCGKIGKFLSLDSSLPSNHSQALHWLWNLSLDLVSFNCLLTNDWLSCLSLNTITPLCCVLNLIVTVRASESVCSGYINSLDHIIELDRKSVV